MTDTQPTGAEPSHPQQYRDKARLLGAIQFDTCAMPANKHQALAYRTAPHSYKPLSFQQFELVHALLGMVSELGEIADTIKKHIIYGRPLDAENLVEEVGDSDWYAALMLTAISEFRSIAMEQNIDKLRKRYPEGYSGLAAMTRADKADVEHEARTANGIVGTRATSNLMPVCSTCDKPLQRVNAHAGRPVRYICNNQDCIRWGLEGSS